MHSQSISLQYVSIDQYYQTQCHCMYIIISFSDNWLVEFCPMELLYKAVFYNSMRHD